MVTFAVERKYKAPPLTSFVAATVLLMNVQFRIVTSPEMYSNFIAFLNIKIFT